jgi:hypothetical protein
MMNILDIYFSPTKYFNRTKEKPKWLIPLIIIVVASILLTLVVLSTFNPEQKLAQLRERNLTPEQMERAQRFMSGPFAMISGVVSALIIVPLALLIAALVFNFLLPLIGTNGVFLVTFCTVVGAALVRIPAIIIKAILILIKKTPFVHTSFALFFPMLSKSSYFFRLMSKLDFFTIWEVILIGLGLKTIYAIKDKRSYYLVFGVWLLYIIITSIFPGRMGAQ